jgi:probable phosphomutase (TIGR03848 family)
MAVLLLIRHALTDQTGKRLYGRRAGVHLSDRGREQAAALAERVVAVRPAALYSSPLERCLETAAPIAETTGLEVERVPGVLEIDYGTWTGRQFSSLRGTKLWERVRRMPSAARFPEGEAMLDVQRRMIAALEDVSARHPRGVVAVVSHGDPIALALAHFLGLHVDLFQRIHAPPASVSAVVLSDAAPLVVRVGDTGTLEDLRPRPVRRPRRG